MKKIIGVDPSFVDEYKEKRQVTQLPNSIVYESGDDLENDELSYIHGIILSDGSFYRANNTIPYHEFVKFLLRRFGLNVTNSLRLCEYGDSTNVRRVAISAENESDKIRLTKEQIISVEKLLKKKFASPWTSLILNNGVYDLGFSPNEKNEYAMLNLYALRETLDNFDYETCLRTIMDNRANKTL